MGSLRYAHTGAALGWRGQGEDSTLYHPNSRKKHTVLGTEMGLEMRGQGPNIGMNSRFCAESSHS